MLINRRTSLLTLVLVALAAFLLYQCASNPTSLLKPIPAGSTILAIGDSLTEGVGTSQDKAYPAVLSRLLNQPVINAGISGNTSTQTLQRLPALLNKYKPSLVIICIGGNDMLKRQHVYKLKANLTKMVEMSQHAGAQVMIIAVPEASLSMKVPELYKDIAEQYQVTLDDTTLRELLRDSQYKSDTVHLNAMGYQALANQIYLLIKSPIN